MVPSTAHLANRIGRTPVVSAKRWERLLGHLFDALGVAWATLFIYWSAVGSGRFGLWSQILQMEAVQLDSLRIFNQAHDLRYALVSLTVLAPAEYLGGDPDRWFGFVIAICIVSTAVLVRATASETVGRCFPGWFFAIMSFWIALSFFMNGRLAYGFLGHAIAVWALVRWAGGKASVASVALLLAVAITLASVSSGQLLVLVAYSSVCLLLAVPRTTRGRVLRARARVLVMVGLAVLSPMLATLVTKNVDYYGGGLVSVFRMLTHGWGRFIAVAGPVWTILVLVPTALWGIGLLVLVRRAASHRPDHMVLMISVLSSGALGLYGFSAFLSGLPAAMVLALDRSQTLMRRLTLH